jgi:hypothetical protein
LATKALVESLGQIVLDKFLDQVAQMPLVLSEKSSREFWCEFEEMRSQNCEENVARRRRSGCHEHISSSC